MRISARRAATCIWLLPLVGMLLTRQLDAQDSFEAARENVTAKYPLTRTTDARDDVVTAGAVLVLKKDGLIMSSVGSSVEAQDNYKDGKLSPSSQTQALITLMKCSFCPHKPNFVYRKFVAGEKFWVTGVETRDDGIVLDFFSDPISDVRYISQVKFPYSRGASVDDLMSRVAEVIKVQPSDDTKADSTKPAPPAPPTPSGPTPPMPPIPPPPPPPDTKTISIGQSRDQVVATFGPPTKIIKFPNKEIDIYPDMKVTFVNDKVIDIQ